MAAQVIEVIVKSIFANVQTEAIIRMTRRSLRHAVIAKHDQVSSLQPRRKANCSRPIQKLKNESLQDYSARR